MRSLAHQTVEELGGRRSILHRQKQDHVRLDRVDRVRGGLDHAARRAPRVVRPSPVSAGDGLGALARRIEQLPPLRRGARSATVLPPEESP